jgi:hypothetical protein
MPFCAFKTKQSPNNNASPIGIRFFFRVRLLPSHCGFEIQSTACGSFLSSVYWAHKRAGICTFILQKDAANSSVTLRMTIMSSGTSCVYLEVIGCMSCWIASDSKTIGAAAKGFGPPKKIAPLAPSKGGLARNPYINPLTPELNPTAQRCLTKFLMGILLLEPCISLIYAWKTNKYNNYSFILLIMYGSSYMFRHYIAIFRERS